MKYVYFCCFQHSLVTDDDRSNVPGLHTVHNAGLQYGQQDDSQESEQVIEVAESSINIPDVSINLTRPNLL